MSQASGASTHPSPQPPVPPRRARPYLRLLLLIPALAMLGVGLYFYYNVEEGGIVTAIELKTKAGMVGQAAEAFAIVDPTNPDLYLKLTTPQGQTQLETKKDTPIGNGLRWDLPQPLELRQVQRVDVWDAKWLRSDKQLDRITVSGWSVDGQRFHIDLHGQRNQPPQWAIPLAAGGGALALLVLLRFVWDQVI
ncbi:hypothetical protein [Fontivita pretiosa]|uniref:hypothetical protein n=1 Tax=Fontivita pretiosa TaxID=2989684 RepID=UPI003D169ABA